jgi:hypothetical protein
MRHCRFCPEGERDAVEERKERKGGGEKNKYEMNKYKYIV